MALFYIEFHVIVISQWLKDVRFRGAGDPPHRSRQGEAASPGVYAMGYLLHAPIRQVAASGNLINPGLSDAMGYLLDSSSCGRCPPAKGK